MGSFHWVWQDFTTNSPVTEHRAVLTRNLAKFAAEKRGPWWSVVVSSGRRYWYLQHVLLYKNVASFRGCSYITKQPEKATRMHQIAPFYVYIGKKFSGEGAQPLPTLHPLRRLRRLNPRPPHLFFCNSITDSKHFVTSQKCPYHVTFTSTLTLSTPWMRAILGNHRVQFWWR